MADDKQRVSGRPRRKITLSMDELNASLDSFLVEPPEAATRGHVVAAGSTEAQDCTFGCSDGVTCNWKCGDTAYWECGPTSVAEGCDTVETCWSCVCTQGGYGGYDTGC